MNNPTIQTLSFLFDNKTDHILFLQISDEGPLKRKYSGIKGFIGFSEDLSEDAERSILEASNLQVPQVVLRGVVKTIQEETQKSVVYLVYESSKFSGELGNKISGQLKWVDILTIFNLEMEPLVQELMPFLLDGESFFEGTVRLGILEEILSSDIRICNSI
jgi:ADP-ribose pyrophosphatase YjhB (NUDIX family)